MDVRNAQEREHEKVVVSEKNRSRVTPAVRECDEQVYFLMLLNNSTLFKKKEDAFGNYQGE